jgi:hypothetical protein
MVTRPLPCLFICLGLLSCTSPKGRSDSKAAPDTTARMAVNTPRPSQKEPVLLFKPLDAALSFAGVWVNKVYFDSIRANRSPRLDQGITASCIIIPDSTLEATNMVAYFHDGGGTMVVVKDGDRYQFYT